MALLPLLVLLSARVGPGDASLPAGVKAVWDLGAAWREATPTRERICLNGLWRWQPGGEELPKGGWGWFKVPGCWPGIQDYMQKDCQTVYANPAWAKQNLGEVTTAWYQRDFTVPSDWKGRRVALSARYVNSLATAYVDGKQVGSITFPAGDIDLTPYAAPGSKHTLSIQLVALPLKGVMMSYSDTNAAKLMKATVQRRGLCGDVFLESTPTAERIQDWRVETSVQNGAITVRAFTKGLSPAKKYILAAKVFDHGRPVTSFESGPIAGADTLSYVKGWKAHKFWDINTPQNQYELELTLLDASKRVLDVQAPKRFGYRELWIKGRDFILNGTRVFWSCVPLDNAAISAGLASYEASRESLRRLKSIGINMVYTHNYNCNPGENLAFDEMLRAADDVGMLVALTQPHFGDYDWSTPNSDTTNGYARHAAFFAQVAGSHPSVIAYSTSHNATGYNEDTNPDMIDGLSSPRDNWSSNNVKKAIRAEAIISKLDSSRLVYHHSSGNLGTMHTMNFYLNFVPIQELDDWYQHWATVGVKPAFMVEYGVPFSWDWSLYRGWYKGERSFGNAQVPWEYTMAEWNAQFLGDRAFKISEAEKRNVRWEADKFKTSTAWFRWDYPFPMGSTNPDFEDQQEVWADYTTDNWRAFRTWGVSGISPWETNGEFWRLKPGVKTGRVELKTDWDHLQRPGYSPDYVDGRYERRDMAFEESDWVPTIGGKSLLRNNGPLLSYIGGKSTNFTDKDHNFLQGSSLEKQIIVVNNSRETVTVNCSWTLALPTPVTGKSTLTVPTGEIQKVPLDFMLPVGLKPGAYKLSATVDFVAREVQKDEFTLDVLPPPSAVAPQGELAIYDPLGETTKVLDSLSIVGTPVSAGADLSKFNTLIIGKRALTPDGGGLDLSRVRDGLKVIVFEQTSEVLEQRFGFRVEEYGLRNVFPRVADHPLLHNLDVVRLRDWRGASTIIKPRISYVLANQFDGAPSVMRNGMLEPRVWRCGNQGNVASVLIEKPACGDFTAIVDGGYSLQYTPLLEYREGKGVIFFCQMDVTGRTTSDPAAEQLLANLLNTVATWRPPLERTVVYAGNAAGKKHLESTGIAVTDYSAPLKQGQLLVVGPSGDVQVASHKQEVASWLADEGRAVEIGLDQDSISNALSLHTATKTTEYINSVFESAPFGSVTTGIGPADVYNRDPRPVPLLATGKAVGSSDDGHVGYFQLAPWTFDPSKINTKRVFRHTSVALTRMLGNFGVHGSTPLLERFGSPVKAGEQRWLKGFYLDTAVLEDDPYRFFGW